MHSSKVEICGVNTSKLPVLKGEEKRKLFELILEGDEEAREKYIFGNLRLVLSIIQRFNNRGEYVDDIFQVGCIGLIKAIDNFDISHGVQFSTYAVPMNDIRREYSEENLSMTRKQALCMALEALKTLAVTEESTASETHATNTEKDGSTKTEVQAACEIIQGMIQDLPLTSWTEKTIFDSINQFTQDHGRTPTVSDFRKKGLPPHPVIKLRFGITLREFLNIYYPENKLCSSKIYFTETKEYWRDCFLADYHANKPCSAEEHNAKRTNGTPSWQTTAKMFSVLKWVAWLNFCNVIPYVNKREYNRNTVNIAPLKITSVMAIQRDDGTYFHVTRDDDGIEWYCDADRNLKEPVWG